MMKPSVRLTTRSSHVCDRSCGMWRAARAIRFDQAEVTGKIEQERKNHDLILEKTKAEGAEARQTRLESIRLASETFGAGVREFLVDKERMTAAIGIISALAVGVYGAKVRHYAPRPRCTRARRTRAPAPRARRVSPVSCLSSALPLRLGTRIK